MPRSPRSVAPGKIEVSARLTIERGATVYLDTHPIIFLAEANPAFRKSIHGLFKALDAVLLLPAQLQAETRSLKVPDAIHVATATRVDADVFVSANLGIRGLPAPMRDITL